MDRTKLIEKIIKLTDCDIETANEIITLVQDNQREVVIRQRRHTRPGTSSNIGRSAGRAVRGELPKAVRKHPSKGSPFVAKGGGSETDDPGPSKYRIRDSIKGKSNV